MEQEQQISATQESSEAKKKPSSSRSSYRRPSRRSNAKTTPQATGVEQTQAEAIASESTSNTGETEEKRLESEQAAQEVVENQGQASDSTSKPQRKYRFERTYNPLSFIPPVPSVKPETIKASTPDTESAPKEELEKPISAPSTARPNLQRRPQRTNNTRQPQRRPHPEAATHEVTAPTNEPNGGQEAPASSQQTPNEQYPFIKSPQPMASRGFGSAGTNNGMAQEYYSSNEGHAAKTSFSGRTVETPPISPNQLASILTQSIQAQTDRLVAELRRGPSQPNMTLSIPGTQATERIGVFVDVANLLYSARSMRIAIDFGKLLDFLRGSRRLVRAHAYCPTNPDPNSEQTFLEAVKGLGYRITTKNYKTFSSGAKKADLDLDLCIDIVRMVDAGAVDCISLVSGDSDFLPLLAYCSDHGVRVEVASFDEAAAAILRQCCDMFINLSLVDEIRA